MPGSRTVQFRLQCECYSHTLVLRKLSNADPRALEGGLSPVHMATHGITIL